MAETQKLRSDKIFDDKQNFTIQIKIVVDVKNYVRCNKQAQARSIGSGRNSILEVIKNEVSQPLVATQVSYYDSCYLHYLDI